MRQCILLNEEAKITRQGNETTVIILGKTDLSNTFRVLPLKISSFCWVVLKAEDPRDGKMKYFVDKCLPFGASISCSHYQRFSNSLKHLLQFRTSRKTVTNYLDDFLFIALLKVICDGMIRDFIQLCNELKVPIVQEKTEWGTDMLVFLGILLEGRHRRLCIPIEKQEKALHLLNDISAKRKATIKDLQVLTGFLNFLARAIVPSRMFTRQMYAKCQQWKIGKNNKRLKQHHHVKLDSEFMFDCKIWRVFLTNFRNKAVCCPMIDLEAATVMAKQLNFSSDASANVSLGMGGVYNDHWLFAKWEPGFIKNYSPSIGYLELFALVASVLTWGHELCNLRMIIFCDNSAVMSMVNNLTSSCQNCMYLLCLLTLNNLINNRRVFVQH